MKNRFIWVETDDSDENPFERGWLECKFCGEVELVCKCDITENKESVDKYRLLNEFLNKKEKQNEDNWKTVKDTVRT